MTLARFLIPFILFGFLNIHGSHAQLLKKLNRRVKQATEDVLVEKAGQKAEQEAGKALDSLLNIDPNYQTKSAEQMQLMMSQNIDSFPIEDTYQFDTNVIYQMEYTSDNQTSKVDYGMWFTKDHNYMGTEIKNINTNESSQNNQNAQVFSIMDEQNKLMIILMEKQKIAQILSMDQVKNVADKENETENIDTEFSKLKKTGKTKKIIGYLCEEFASSNSENKISLWVTNEIALFQKNMFYNISKSLGGNTFGKVPDDAKGFMMEMYFENMENGEKSQMVVIEINKKDKAVSPRDYQFMNLSMFMSN